MGQIAIRSKTELTPDFVQQAEALLAKATTAYDAKKIRDQVVTIAAWAKERGASVEAIGHAKHAKLLAEVRIGKLCAAMEPLPPEISGGIREGSNDALPPSKQSQLDEAGITKMQASRWERL